MSEKVTRQELQEILRQYDLEKKVLWPKDAAQQLNVSVRTFYRLVDEGLIETIRLRPGQIRGIRCTALALEKYLASCAMPEP